MYDVLFNLFIFYNFQTLKIKLKLPEQLYINCLHAKLSVQGEHLHLCVEFPDYLN